MMRLVIKGGRVIDPATKLDGLYNLYVMGGRIASLRPVSSDEGAPERSGEGLEVIDATGLVVMPGLIDLHTHLREPGYEYKETILTGSEAAAKGGFTTILCMANTNPVNDNSSVTRYILKKAEEGPVNVLPVGAVSCGLRGERLTEMGELKEAGCVAVSDDGVPVMRSSLMRRALEYSRIFNIPVISHAEDRELAAEGVMNEGEVSTRLGLNGIPNGAEDVVAARDIILSELTGGRLHIAHVSTKGTVDLIRAAKERGVRVTAEATPHHLALNHEAVTGYNTDAKMNPPLRSPEDVLALRAGVKDGTIDSIATDHAPQSVIEKDVEFDRAANGVVGLETAFSVIYGLVEVGVLSLGEAVGAMTVNPALAMGLEKGTVRVGSIADVTIVDLNRTWTVEPAKLRSRSKNTPFKGMAVKAKVMYTIVNGKTVYRDEEAGGPIEADRV